MPKKYIQLPFLCNPASREIFATSNEPFSELGPLEETFTYAFRARARNGAGYGGYTEIWYVVVV